ncbi:MAG: universal stress protein [Verrucomicrobiota bacterium]
MQHLKQHEKPWRQTRAGNDPSNEKGQQRKAGHMKTNGETAAAVVSPSNGGATVAADHDNSGARPVFKSQTILVPVSDLSATATQALRYAIPFARQMNARIIFLHILPVTGAPAWKYDGVNHEWFFDAHVQRDMEQKLGGFANKSFPTDVPVEIEVRYGAPAAKIVHAAVEMDVNLIIMCTHAHRGWIHFLIGSVASDVARRAPCPVLVVREQEHEFVVEKPSALKAGEN